MKFAADKVQHGYLPAYLRIAAELGPAARVCEVGVLHGLGLNMLRPCTRTASSQGSTSTRTRAGRRDEDPGSSPLQDDPELARQALAVLQTQWDLIIDDASHNGNLPPARRSGCYGR